MGHSIYSSRNVQLPNASYSTSLQSSVVVSSSQFSSCSSDKSNTTSFMVSNDLMNRMENSLADWSLQFNCFSVESTALRLITGLGSAEVQPQLSRFLNEPKTLVSAESEELNRALVLTLARSMHVTGTGKYLKFHVLKSNYLSTRWSSTCGWFCLYFLIFHTHKNSL